MGINRKILKIIEKCPREYEETSKVLELLSEDALKLKEPLSLQRLARFDYTTVLREIGRNMNRSYRVDRVIDNIHNAEAAYIPIDDFV